MKFWSGIESAVGGLEMATRLYHRGIDCFNFEIYPDRPLIARTHPIFLSLSGFLTRQ
jgi:hypothetical protein